MSYTIEPNNRFMQAARELTEHETNPRVTVELFSLVDLTQVEALRTRAVETGPEKPTYTAFVVKAVALALKEHPNANRRVIRRPWLPFVGPRLQSFHHCDIAVAAERPFPGTELITLVDIIRDADQKSLAEITAWLRALATSDTSNNEQWRQFHSLISRLPTWLSAQIIRLPVWLPGAWVRYRGAAVLLTSPAKYGADRVSPFVTSPLGFAFGLVRKRPVVVDDRVVPRPTFHLVLKFDRRVMHGTHGARFFQRVVDILENALETMS